MELKEMTDETRGDYLTAQARPDEALSRPAKQGGGIARPGTPPWGQPAKRVGRAARPLTCLKGPYVAMMMAELAEPQLAPNPPMTTPRFFTVMQNVQHAVRDRGYIIA